MALSAGERRDIIEINIPERSINVRLSDEELAERRKAEEARGKKAFTPPTRQREVSKALRAYGKMVSSADKGGVRIVERLKPIIYIKQRYFLWRNKR